MPAQSGRGDWRKRLIFIDQMARRQGWPRQTLERGEDFGIEFDTESCSGSQ
jgi:hypothetical protein